MPPTLRSKYEGVVRLGAGTPELGEMSICPTALATVLAGAPVLDIATVIPVPPTAKLALPPLTGLMLALLVPDPCELLGMELTAIVKDAICPTIVAVTVTLPTAAPTTSTEHWFGDAAGRVHWFVGMLVGIVGVRDR